MADIESIGKFDSDQLMLASNELAREKGTTIEYEMLKMVWDPDVEGAVKADIFKAYMDCLMCEE